MNVSADDETSVVDITPPASSGHGSSRTAWIAYAEAVAVANAGLTAVIKRQRRVISFLNASISELEIEKEQRKPKGSRERLPSEKVSRIMHAIQDGGSTRFIASQFGVSAMTVSRISKRMKAPVSP